MKQSTRPRRAAPPPEPIRNASPPHPVASGVESAARGRWLARAGIAIAVIAAGAVSLALLRSPRSYPQESPEALIASARQMVVDGNARRLPELVWTDEPGMRRVLLRIGGLMGRLEQLGETIAESFPEEVADMRRQAEAAAASGEGGSIVAQVLTGQRRSGRADPGGMEQRLNLLLREIFVDPYGWLQRSEGRLTHEYITDDVVGLAWDGRGILGLRLVEHGGKWYIDSPTNLAAVRPFFPSDDDAYRIMESLVATLDNAVRDLEMEVRTGQIRSLAGVSAEAGEKAAPMFVFGVIAYGKYLEERDKTP